MHVSSSEIQDSDLQSTCEDDESSGVESGVDCVTSVPRSLVQRTHSGSPVCFSAPEELAPVADNLIDGASHQIPRNGRQSNQGGGVC